MSRCSYKVLERVASRDLLLIHLWRISNNWVQWLFEGIVGQIEGVGAFP